MKGALQRWWRRWQGSPASDAVSAVALTVVLVAGSYGEAHPSRISDQVSNGHHVPYTPDAAFALVAVSCLVLALRRRYPLLVLAVSTAAVVAYSALGYENGAALLAPSVALFSVARAEPLRRSLIAAAATLAALGIATVAANPFGPFGGGDLLIPALIAAPLFGGIAVRSRSAYVASLQEHAEGEARRRVDEERLRIARELHDIVAHSMATINVQAGVAEHVLAANPAAAGEALRAIKLASKDGLRELRAILNVLRQADEGDPTQPAPGLAQLDALVAGASNLGLPTTVTLTGTVRPLPAGVDLAAYRIIQESLTNAIRHAGPARATVRIGYEDAALRIDVTNTARGATAVAGLGATGGVRAGASARAGGLGGGSGLRGRSGQGGGSGLRGRSGQGGEAGHGIVGMKERAAALGGSLTVGPEPGGGYRVSAILPIEGEATAEAGDAYGSTPTAAAGPAPAGSAAAGSAAAGSAAAGSAAAGKEASGPAVTAPPGGPDGYRQVRHGAGS